MPDNPFDELLQEFREAYAQFGDETFFLAAYTREEWHAEEEQLLGAGYELLGSVPLAEDEETGRATVYCIAAQTRLLRWDRWTEERGEFFDVFKQLAAKAGASLPLAVREQVPVEPAHPVSWWLSFMWCKKPPSDEELSLPLGERGNWLRLFSVSPFLDSVEVIERFLLGPARRATTGGLDPGEVPADLEQHKRQYMKDLDTALRGAEGREHKQAKGGTLEIQDGVKRDRITHPASPGATDAAPQAEAKAQPDKPPVELHGEDQPVTVLGNTMPALTPGRYRAVQALVDAWPDGLSKDALEITGGGGVRRSLYALRKADKLWEQVISFPGQKGQGRGYRLILPKS